MYFNYDESGISLDPWNGSGMDPDVREFFLAVYNRQGIVSCTREQYQQIHLESLRKTLDIPHSQFYRAVEIMNNLLWDNIWN